MANIDEAFHVYHHGPIFPDAFGSPTIVVTAKTDVNNNFRGEFFILYRDNEEKLLFDYLQIQGAEISPDVLRVDIELVYQEALDRYRELIHQAYPQAVEWHLFAAPFEFVQVDKFHLARLWLRDKFHAQLTEIQRNTMCRELQSLLEEVSHLPVITSSKKP